MKEVYKLNQNNGRRFYICSRPKAGQCDFFQWREEATKRAKEELKGREEEERLNRVKEEEERLRRVKDDMERKRREAVERRRDEAAKKAREEARLKVEEENKRRVNEEERKRKVKDEIEKKKREAKERLARTRSQQSQRPPGVENPGNGFEASKFYPATAYGDKTRPGTIHPPVEDLAQ